MSSDDPLFLDAEDVVEIHATQLEVYGGSVGLGDRGLLESAVAQPQASFGEAFAHDGLFEMAAAYLFHIVRNHPFVDGNKRAGPLASVVFLDVNGISIADPSDALYELNMGVAEGRVEKAAIAAELERASPSLGACSIPREPFSICGGRGHHRTLCKVSAVAKNVSIERRRAH